MDLRTDSIGRALIPGLVRRIRVRPGGVHTSVHTNVNAGTRTYAHKHGRHLIPVRFKTKPLSPRVLFKLKHLSNQAGGNTKKLPLNQAEVNVINSYA